MLADTGRSGGRGFGAGDQLIVINDMGFCTMRANGFDRLPPHLEERAAGALAGPDPVAAPGKGAAKREWLPRAPEAEA